MPVVTVGTRVGLSANSKAQILAAIHESLVAAFKIPAQDQMHRFVDHAPENFPVPPGRTERFTLVEIAAFPGRSSDAKRTLYREMAERLAPLGIATHDLVVTLTEIPRDDWGLDGLPASDRYPAR